MTQIFFVSPIGLPNEQAMDHMHSFRGVTLHCWLAEGTTSPAICAAYVASDNADIVAEELEKLGMTLLPNQLTNTAVGSEIATHLSPYKVTEQDTTSSAMAKVVAVSGWAMQGFCSDCKNQANGEKLLMARSWLPFRFLSPPQARLLRTKTKNVAAHTSHFGTSGFSYHGMIFTTFTQHLASPSLESTTCSKV